MEISSVIDQFLKSIRSNPPFCEHDFKLIMRINLVDSENIEHLTSELFCEDLKFALADWYKFDHKHENAEQLFKEKIDSEVRKLFHTIISSDKKIDINGEPTIIPESLNIDNSFVHFYLGDYSDSANPETYWEGKFFLSGHHDISS